MAVTISGTDGIVGAGFTVDASGISVTAGVVTATSINANASGLTGELPAGIDIPAAQIVGICTAGLTKTGGFGKYVSHAIIGDQKSADTAGGTFTSGAWRTRDLNAEISDPDGIVSISSNQFTLAAGTYLIQASAPCHRANNHIAKLYNVTDSADVEGGTSEWSHSGYATSTRSFISARFTISSSKTFEIQHRCSHTYSTIGFGRVTDLGIGELFTLVEIFKEA